MKEALFLYNPQSGRGRIERHKEAILEVFRRAGYAIHAVAIDFLKNPFEEHPSIDLVVVAGGDGTVNFAVNRIKACGINPAIGIIPAGTANDFARAIGMSSDPVKAAYQIATGSIEYIDCGCVNGLYFVNIFSFGLFTTTSQHTSDERKHRWGKLAYIAEGLKELRRMHRIPLSIEADGRNLSIDALIVLLFNGETAGGFHLARRSSVTDGLFDLLILEKRNFLASCWAMIRFLMGGKPRAVHHLQATHLTIRSSINEPTDVDGQQGATFPLTIECLKGALPIQCAPQHADA